ncbi:MAG: hypothetical protein RL563_336 [Pseudomonadota bacterium]
MPIIKDKQILENHWSFIADDQTLSANDIIVSLTRWNKDQNAIQNHTGKVGIRLTPGDTLDTLDNAANAAVIELDFPAFNDGRLFSLARLLRDAHDYQGEIRAVGKFLADQVFYLHRVGVDSFELNEARDIEVAQAALHDFSVRYQGSTR